MQTKLLVFFLFAGVAKLFGQVEFTKSTVVDTPNMTYQPQHVRAADVDGDNDLDVISYGQSLTWYKNVDGLGNFGAKIMISASAFGLSGTSLHMIDIDNDGDLDILCSYNNKFQTYRNTDGQGNFQLVQTITAGINTSTTISILPEDMDADGDLDVLCLYHASGAFLVWYPNDGTGSIGAEQILSDDSNLIGTSCLFLEDLDGDNDKDIIFGNKSYGKIGWLNNLGNGTYSLPVTISTLCSGITSIETSDIDNDGDMDVISTTESDNQVVWYQNLNGLGIFSDENVITNAAVGSNALLVTDINNDDNDDIIYAATNEIGWMSNTNGLGNFGSQQVITDKAFSVRDVTMADLDGDGTKDLISASQEDDKIAWYKNNNGSFGRQNVIAGSLEFPNNVYPGDFDGDNDIDLLVNSQHDAKLAWFENVNGLGFYGKQHIITENIAVGNYTPIAYPVDIDADGDLDIACSKNSMLIWYENDGNGNFTENTIDPTSTGITLIRSKDIDGDGNMDIVCVAYSSGIISWYKNLGNGIFGSEQIIEDLNLTLTSVEIADIDGDNDMDIIASTYDWDTYYYKNTNGLGNFVLQASNVFDGMEAVYPADMDGDGDNDIVGLRDLGGGSLTPSVVWYENTDGQGDFTIEHTISQASIRGRAVHAADIDNDGDMDVFTASGIQATGQLAWYENLGNGTFAPIVMMHETTDYTIGLCITTADVDNDNDLDVLSVFGYNANSTIGEVLVFKNMGTQLSVPQNDVKEFLIYPNPTSGLLNIQGNEMIEKISIVDINGRILKKFKVELRLSTQLDITNLPAGIYFLKAQSNRGNTTNKFIKR